MPTSYYIFSGLYISHLENTTYPTFIFFPSVNEFQVMAHGREEINMTTRQNKPMLFWTLWHCSGQSSPSLKTSPWKWKSPSKKLGFMTAKTAQVYVCLSLILNILSAFNLSFGISKILLYIFYAGRNLRTLVVFAYLTIKHVICLSLLELSRTFCLIFIVLLSCCCNLDMQHIKNVCVSFGKILNPK